MPFHDKTALPAAATMPSSLGMTELSAADRFEITELLNRVYLCEDGRHTEQLAAIFADGFVNEHPLFGRHEGRDAFIEWLNASTQGFDGIRHHCLNSSTFPLDDGDAGSVSYILVVQLFPAASRGEQPSEEFDAKMPRVIGQGVVRDRWTKPDHRWQLKHRVYEQMSISPAFLPDSSQRDKAAEVGGSL